MRIGEWRAWSRWENCRACWPRAEPATRKKLLISCPVSLLQRNRLVVVAGSVNCIVQISQQAGAIARHEIDTGNFAFLERFVGEQRMANRIGVAADHFVAQLLGARCLPMQTVHLMPHAHAGAVGGSNERGIQLADHIAESS